MISSSRACRTNSIIDSSWLSRRLSMSRASSLLYLRGKMTWGWIFWSNLWQHCLYKPTRPCLSLNWGVLLVPPPFISSGSYTSRFYEEGYLLCFFEKAFLSGLRSSLFPPVAYIRAWNLSSTAAACINKRFISGETIAFSCMILSVTYWPGACVAFY